MATERELECDAEQDPEGETSTAPVSSFPELDSTVGDEPPVSVQRDTSVRRELTPREGMEELFDDLLISSAWRLRRLIRLERELLQAGQRDERPDTFIAFMLSMSGSAAAACG